MRDQFIGRHQDLELLQGMLDADARLISLQGPPGCGKTRLAVEIGRRNTTRGSVLFCDLCDARTGDDIVARLAHLLEIEPNMSDLPTFVGIELARHPNILVVLDTFEHLGASATQTLEALHDRAPDATFMVTSRHRLDVRHARTVVLDPLSLPKGHDPDHVLASDAVQFFLAQSRMQGRRIERPAAQMVTEIAELVCELDGLPLAIELASTRVRVMSPGQILGMIRRRLDILRSRGTGRMRRHASFVESLTWSWNLLTPWEQSALAQLSVFRGAFTLDAAEQIVSVDDFSDAPMVLDVVESLVDKSMVRAHVGAQSNDTWFESRIEVLGVIRRFAASKLLDIAQTQPNAMPGAVQRRHALHMASRVAPYEADLRAGQVHAPVLRALVEARDNLFAAMEHALTHQMTDEACILALGVCFVAERKGPLEVAIQHVSHVLEHRELTTKNQASMLAMRARLRRLAGQVALAHEDLAAALDLATELGEPRRIAHLRIERAALRSNELNVDGTHEDIQDALAIATQLTDPQIKQRALGQLAIVELQAGERVRALAHFAEAREGAIACSMHRDEAVWDAYHTVCALMLSTPTQHPTTDTLCKHLTSAMEQVEQLADASTLGILLTLQARVDLRRGRLSETQVALARAEHIAQTLGGNLRSALAQSLKALIDTIAASHPGFPNPS